MRSRNRSSGCLRPKSFVAGDRGGIWKPSNSRRSTGWTGSIIAGCSNRLATYHQPSMRHATMSRPPWPDSHNSLSHDPGTLHGFLRWAPGLSPVFCRRCRRRLPRSRHRPVASERQINSETRIPILRRSPQGAELVKYMGAYARPFRLHDGDSPIQPRETRHSSSSRGGAGRTSSAPRSLSTSDSHRAA